MATISYVINAINNASKTFDAVAASAAKMGATIDAAQAQVDKLNGTLAAQNAAATAAAAGMDKVARAATAAALAQNAAAASAVRAGVAAGGGAIGWGRLLGQVALFGGIAAVGGLHLLIDGVVEFLAVVIPATVAVTAFGIAASDAAVQVYTQFTNMHTVMDATQKTIYPMTRSLENLHNAVRPQVFQLLGDAITVVSAKSSEFNKIAMATGTVLDQLGARAAVAIQSSGMSEFLSHAVSDVAGIGAVIGNLFGIIGNLLKAMPGYAEVLLNILKGVTGALEAVTGSGVVQGIIRIGLAFHGAFIYVGLAATAIIFLSTAIYTRLIPAIIAMGEAILASPYTPFILLAAAIVAVTLVIVRSKNATQEWIDSLQSGIMNATSLIQGMVLLQQDQLLVTQHLAAAQDTLTKTQDKIGVSTNKYGAALKAVALATAAVPVQELTAAQKQLADQSALVTDRMARLAVTFHGLGPAMGIAIAAGITMKQFLDPNDWAIIVQQVEATTAAYKAMGQQGGVLGADMNALNLAASDQLAAMTKLNGAWDTIFGIITGGQNAFITFQQDVLSVDKSLQGTGGTGRTVTDTFKSAAAAAKAAGASMNGLNGPSLQLRATWQSAYGAGLQLIDALSLMQSISPGGFPSVKAAAKDVVAQIINLGAGSAATRAEIVSLVDRFQPGIKTFQQATQWVGNTTGAAHRLNRELALMGGNIENIAADARNLSGTLQTDIINQFDIAKLSASHASAEIKILAADIEHTGLKSAATHGAEVQLYNDFVKDGLSAKNAQALIEGMTGSIFKIPKHSSWTMNANVTGNGARLLLALGGSIGGGLIGQVPVPKKAAGGMISGGVRGRDSVLVAAMPGEVIVPTHMVQAGAVNHLRGRLPGFAAGGMVPSYGLGESWPPGGAVPLSAVGGQDDVPDLLRELIGAVDDLISVTASGPAQTTAGMTRAFSTAARSGGYRAMYGSQG